MSSRNCCRFSADEFDPDAYNEAQAQGDLVLPVRIGYPPRFDADAKFVFNVAATQRARADLRQETDLAITAKSAFIVHFSVLGGCYQQEN